MRVDRGKLVRGLHEIRTISLDDQTANVGLMLSTWQMFEKTIRKYQIETAQKPDVQFGGIVVQVGNVG